MPNLHDMSNNHHQLSLYYGKSSAAWWIERAREEGGEVCAASRNKQRAWGRKKKIGVHAIYGVRIDGGWSSRTSHLRGVARG